MATGLNKTEFTGQKSTTAKATAHRAPPLPPKGAEITLSYPGKLSREEILNNVSTNYLSVSTGGESVEIDKINLDTLLWADNWFGLHSIIESGLKAQLIYLDPPYATGFDFVSRNQEHAYGDVMSAAAYVEFMRRRLVLIHELLDDNGSVYVHIGHQMVAETKLLLDEIFGPKNFRNLITRRKCSSKNFTKLQYSNLNDYLLFYSKSDRYIWNQPKVRASDEWITKEYPKMDQRGQYKLVPVHAPGVRRGETGGLWRNMEPPPGKHWQYVPAKLDEFDLKGEIHWSKNGNPRRKVYLTDDKALPVTDYWDSFRDAHHQSVLITGYPTEKNFDMLKMIVEASSNPGDLVIDPFTGSGSTIDAARVLGRNWIGIDESFTAIKTCINRLRLGRQQMGDYVSKSKNGELFENLAVHSHLADAKLTIAIDLEMVNSFQPEVTQIVDLML